MNHGTSTREFVCCATKGSMFRHACSSSSLSSQCAHKFVCLSGPSALSVHIDHTFLLRGRRITRHGLAGPAYNLVLIGRRVAGHGLTGPAGFVFAFQLGRGPAHGLLSGSTFLYECPLYTATCVGVGAPSSALDAPRTSSSLCALLLHHLDGDNTSFYCVVMTRKAFMRYFSSF